MIDGEAHAFGEQRSLQSATAVFGNRGGSGEEGDTFIDGERTGRSGGAVDFGEEARAIFAGDKQGAGGFEEVFEFGVFVGPAARVDGGPEAGFVHANNAHCYARGRRRRGLFDGAVEHVADFEGTVAAGTEEVHGLSAGEGTDLVHGGCGARKEELLDGVEGIGGQRLEEAEAEGLGGGCFDAVKDDVGPGDAGPSGRGIGVDALASGCKLRAGVAFRGFEAFGELAIGKEHLGGGNQRNAGDQGTSQRARISCGDREWLC